MIMLMTGLLTQGDREGLCDRERGGGLITDDHVYDRSTDTRG